MISRRSILLGAGGAALMLAGCQTDVPLDGSRPLLDVLDSIPDISRMRAAIRRAGLDEMLAGAGPFTVFAPSNTAWAQAPEAVRNGEPAAIRALIAHGRMRTPELARRGQQNIQMLSGLQLRLVGGTADLPRIQALRGGAPQGASASITRGNLMASNGVVHIIDAILLAV